MSQSRSEILREFYEAVVSKTDLPELTFVNAVSSARVVCWDKLREIEGIEDSDSITIDWREEILFPFYESINDVLLPGGQSFLKTAPRIRDIVAFYKRILKNENFAPFFEVGKLELIPGDVLVVKIKENCSLRQEHEISDAISNSFEGVFPDVKIICFFGEVDFSVIREVPQVSGGES